MEVTRRKVLIGAAAGGGLLVAWALRSRSYPAPLSPGKNEYGFDAWLKIGTDGVVTVAVPQLEMGQGITTLLPQIVAVELGADWRQIAVEPVPSSGAYANVPLAAKWAPLWTPHFAGIADAADDFIARRFAQTSRFTATAEGTSLAAYEHPCRNAAAGARAVLAMAAADRWDVSWEECEAQGGFITHGDKRLTFAALAQDAAGYSLPDPAPLRPDPAQEAPISGGGGGSGDFQRLDLPSKVDGSFLYSADVRLPDMVFASIRHGQLLKPKLTSFNKPAAAGIKGLVAIIEGKRWLAAVADSWWAADQALSAMTPHFDVPEPVQSETITQLLDTGVRSGKATRVAERGAGDAVMDKPDLALRYDIAPAVHAALETSAATARYADGRLELWIASQAPERARAAAAKALGLSAADVVLYPMAAGGSFDLRLDHDHAIEAALIAREVAKDRPRPVQLMWSRGQEMLAARPRTPAAVLVTAHLLSGGQGEIESLKLRMAAPSTALEFGHRLFGNMTSWAAIEAAADKADPMALEGAMPSYAIPNVAVDHVPVKIALPTGRMRGNAHGITAFVVESFIDEMAWRQQREPLSYRIEMLGEDVRLAQCLQNVARLAGWDAGKDQSGQGLACHRIGEGRIACVATARRDDGGARVIKMSAVVDIGRIVNLDIARQQIEGGLVFGMAMALGASTDYSDGEPLTTRLADLHLPQLADCPEIEVDFIASEEDPVDPGELGAVVAAPAIANALHSATGLRLRHLPLFSEDL